MDPAIAESELRARLAADPTRAVDWATLGDICLGRGELEEAGWCFSRLGTLDRTSAWAFNRLGIVFHRQGRIPDAVAAYTESLRLDPTRHRTRSMLLLARLCDHRDGPETIAHEHFAFGASIAASPLPDAAPPTGPIRVGYLSPDFRTHPVATFMEPLLAAHDRGVVDVHLYHDSTEVDDVSRRLQQLGHWRDVRDLDDEALVAAIAADGLDLLVELAGHSGHTRLACLARRPAPRIVAYLGYPATTGCPFVQTRITDALTDPPDGPHIADGLYTEHLLRLPTPALAWRPPAAVPIPSRGGEPVVFGVFNQLAKLNISAAALWSAILRQTPGSRLLVKAPALRDPQTRTRFLEMLRGVGIDPGLVDIRGWTESHADHLAGLAAADVALDSIPYSGTTTTFDSLWMGVPVVTLATTGAWRRGAVTPLTGVGLTDLIAADAGRYIAAAVALAHDRPRLAHLRSTLRDTLLASPLTDGHRLARAMEDAFRQIVSPPPPPMPSARAPR